MTMGADLVVLAVDEARGCVRLEQQLGFALAAAELVDLARARRIEVTDGTIVVIESLRTGDPVLDDTLAGLGAASKYHTVAGWVAMQAVNRVAVHLEAMIRSGEIEGRLTKVSLNSPAQPAGLRLADPDRRSQLIKKLADAVLYEAPLEDEAFAALAKAADIPGHVLAGRTKHRVEKDLKPLLTWFTDTWRYLPGVTEELALGDEDVEEGGVNPAYDEPWRLLARLAVGEAVKYAERVTRKSERENGLSKDVQNVILLGYAIDHHL
jgi:Golgi phosphoprotein 3 (GPP34)